MSGRVLIIDDDAAFRFAMAKALRRVGDDVTEATSGEEAVTLLTAPDMPDVALLDLDLPGLDGLALAQQLRARGFDAPLLAVTARADGEAEPLAREAGFDGFLRKPLTGAMLAEAIEALLPPDGDDDRDAGRV